MVDLMEIPIGNSGFSYIEDKTKRKNKYIKNTVKIINTKTKEVSFTLTGGFSWGGKGLGAVRQYYSNNTKEFLGFDNKYYHIEATDNTTNWGEIQSDGAVLKSNRTILKYIDFYPLYIKQAPEVIPSISSSIIPKKVVKEETWIQKIINWIMKILNN